MTTYPGKEGSITFGGSAIGEMTGWTLDTEIDILDDTVLGDDWKTILGGLGSWSGSCAGFIDYDDAQQAAAIVDIMASSPSGDSVALVFLVASGKTFGGNALVSSLNLDLSKDNVVGVTFNFTGNGALTPTWA